MHPNKENNATNTNSQSDVENLQTLKSFESLPQRYSDDQASPSELPISLTDYYNENSAPFNVKNQESDNPDDLKHWSERVNYSGGSRKKLPQQHRHHHHHGVKKNTLELGTSGGKNNNFKKDGQTHLPHDTNLLAVPTALNHQLGVNNHPKLVSQGSSNSYNFANKLLTSPKLGVASMKSDQWDAQVKLVGHVRKDSKNQWDKEAARHALNMPGLSRRLISSHKDLGALAAASGRTPTTTLPIPPLQKPSWSFDSNRSSQASIMPHKLFVQMEEYGMEDTLIGGHHQWKEISRWIKYEEDLEELSGRWGKPHVPILSFHGLAELRKRLERGTVILNMEGDQLNYHTIMTNICKELRNEGYLAEQEFEPMLNCLLKPHKHHQNKSLFSLPSAKISFQKLSKLSLSRPSIIPTIPKTVNTSQSNTGPDSGKKGLADQQLVDNHQVCVDVNPLGPTIHPEDELRLLKTSPTSERMIRTPRGDSAVRFDFQHNGGFSNVEESISTTTPTGGPALSTTQNANNTKASHRLTDYLKIPFFYRRHEGYSLDTPNQRTQESGTEPRGGLFTKVPALIKQGNLAIPELQTQKKEAKDKKALQKHLSTTSNTSKLENGKVKTLPSVHPVDKKSSSGLFGHFNTAFATHEYNMGEDREGVLVLIGSALCLSSQITVFVRLKEATIFPPGIMEDARIAARFIIIIMGPSSSSTSSGPPSHPSSALNSRTNISMHNTSTPNGLIRSTKIAGETDYQELGRTFSSLMSNEGFNELAYKAQSCRDLTSAFNTFLKESIVLPPGEFGRSTLMPITNLYKEQLLKKKLQKDQIEWGRNKGLDKKAHKRDQDQTTVETLSATPGKFPGGGGGGWRRPFGGLIDDVKRKIPFYPNDFTNAFKLQCLSTFVFIYFACLSPCITFGGILSTETDNWLGVSETMISTSVSGCIFALLSGQPLTIIGPTGPMLIFEDSLYKFSVQNRINYLAFRVWVAIWVFVITLIFLAIQAGFLTRYLTRFIQEIFSILISFIFIYETFFNLYNIFKQHPLLPDYCHLNITIDPFTNKAGSTMTGYNAARDFFAFFFPVSTMSKLMGPPYDSKATTDITSISTHAQTGKLQLNNSSQINTYLDRFRIYTSYPNGTVSTDQYLYKIPYFALRFPSDYSLSELGSNQHRIFEKYLERFHIIRPNTALFTTLLMFGTFFIAYFLKVFRNSKYFGRGARRALADFGVPIAIVTMIIFAHFVGKNVYTLKLNVPSIITPTSPERRGWFIRPIWGPKPLIVPTLAEKYGNDTVIYDQMGKLNITTTPTPDTITTTLSSTAKNLPKYIPAGVAAFFYAPITIKQIFLAIYPAIMIFILLFLEGMITCLIVNRKDRKFIKGPGYNLDLLILGTLPIPLSLLGLPFVSGATVRSLAHVSSLTVFSRSHAPGEPPAIIGVLEQRVTAFAVSLCIGLSMLFSKYLQKIPVAILFGIFLYMGISSLKGIQFFDRILLMLMPLKHYPTLNYLRNIGLFKLHLYTLIQISCLIALWAVKLSVVAQAFPFVLIIYIIIRFQLHWIYTPKELYELDKDDEGTDSEDDIDITEEIHMPI